MMKRRSNGYGKMSDISTTTASSTSREEVVKWEMRPGGMLVQKRSDGKDVSAPNIRLRVAYGALRYEISVNSQATFGKMSWIYIYKICF